MVIFRHQPPPLHACSPGPFSTSTHLSTTPCRSIQQVHAIPHCQLLGRTLITWMSTVVTACQHHSWGTPFPTVIISTCRWALVQTSTSSYGKRNGPRCLRHCSTLRRSATQLTLVRWTDQCMGRCHLVPAFRIQCPDKVLPCAHHLRTAHEMGCGASWTIWWEDSRGNSVQCPSHLIFNIVHHLIRNRSSKPLRPALYQHRPWRCTLFVCMCFVGWPLYDGFLQYFSSCILTLFFVYYCHVYFNYSFKLCI